jgi:hypothetical protein
MLVPLEHSGEKEFAEGGISFGFRHEIKKLVGVAQERIVDAVLELLSSQELDTVAFERGAYRPFSSGDAV